MDYTQADANSAAWQVKEGRHRVTEFTADIASAKANGQSTYFDEAELVTALTTLSFALDRQDAIRLALAKSGERRALPPGP